MWQVFLGLFIRHALTAVGGAVIASSETAHTVANASAQVATSASGPDIQLLAGAFATIIGVVLSYMKNKKLSDGA